MKRAAEQAAREHFKPEFLNRLTELLVFAPLGPQEIRSIVALELQKLGERLRAQDHTLAATDAALDHLAQTGFDPEFGARPLKRAIEKQVTALLARKLLAGELPAGAALKLDYRSGVLTVDAEVAATA